MDLNSRVNFIKFTFDIIYRVMYKYPCQVSRFREWLAEILRHSAIWEWSGAELLFRVELPD